MNDEMSEPTPPPRRRWRWRWLRREAINLGDFVVQIIAVVIGILLALFINHWATQRQHQAIARQAMHAIRAELAANRVALHESVAYLYERSARMLTAPGNQGQPPRPCYLWDAWGGTGAVNVTDAAYRTAIATRAMAYMPFKQAQQVAQTYGVQGIKKKSFALIRGNILIAGPHTLGLCISAVASFAANERQMSAAYTPLIGPDPKQWPTPPSNPTQSNPAK